MGFNEHKPPDIAKKSLGASWVVRVSERDLNDAKRLLDRLANATKAVTDTSDTVDEANTAALLRSQFQQRAFEILSLRRKRQEIFGRAMFGEPAWEMLLVLYLSNSGVRQTLSRLVDVSGASRSTAIRWIEYLESQKLIRREEHPTDKRTCFVELTEHGVNAIELYLYETLQQ